MNKIIPINDYDVIKNKLLNQEVIIIPSDTVYSLSGLVKFPIVKSKITKLKNQPIEKEIIILVSSIKQLKNIIKVDNNFLVEKILQKKYPPITLLGIKKPHHPLSKFMSSTNKIAVRITSNKLLQKLINDCGPIFTTSINKHGKPFFNTWEDVTKFGNLYCIYDKNYKPLQTPSRIYDVDLNKWLR